MKGPSEKSTNIDQQNKTHSNNSKPLLVAGLLMFTLLVIHAGIVRKLIIAPYRHFVWAV
jgi:hypothetical protein